jgi:hypothetical protein
MLPLIELMRRKRQAELLREATSADPALEEDAAMDSLPMPQQHTFKIGLKRRKRAQMVRDMMEQGGYGSLSKLLSIREGVNDDGY